MGNVQSEKEEVLSRSQQLLQETVGVTEFERSVQVSKQVWKGVEVNRQVVTGGLMISDNEMRQLWHEYDRDKNGELDAKETRKFLTDLLVILEKREQQNVKNQIEALICKRDMYKRNGWDYDKAMKDAKILQKHLPDIFQSFKNNVDVLVKELDANGDGTIVFDEFLRFCKIFNVHEQRKKLYGDLPGEGH